MIFSELKEEVKTNSYTIGSSNLKIKRILRKVTENSEPENGVLPLSDIDLDQSMPSISSDTFKTSIPTVKLTDNIEPVDGILPLVDVDLDQSMQSVSSDTFNTSIPTVAVSNL